MDKYERTARANGWIVHTTSKTDPALKGFYNTVTGSYFGWATWKGLYNYFHYKSST